MIIEKHPFGVFFVFGISDTGYDVAVGLAKFSAKNRKYNNDNQGN
jgi:hypothetical protein